MFAIFTISAPDCVIYAGNFNLSVPSYYDSPAMDSTTLQDGQLAHRGPWGTILLLVLPIALLFPISLFVTSGPCIVALRDFRPVTRILSGTLVLAVIISTIFGCISLFKLSSKHKAIALFFGIPVGILNTLVSFLLLYVLLEAFIQ